EFGQGGAKVDGGRGLTHAALLVDHGDDPRGTVRCQGGRFRELGQRPAGGAQDILVRLPQSGCRTLFAAHVSNPASIVSLPYFFLTRLQRRSCYRSTGR